MAAMMTTRTDYEGINEDKVLGFVGAVDSTTIHNFLIGFEQGVASVDSEIKVLPVYVGDYNDPATGKELALSLYDQGADIIYAAASNSGDGVSEAAVELGRYVIGVDTDKSFQGPENVMGSMLKNVTKSFYDVIAAKNNGETLDAEQRCGLSKKWVEMCFIDSMAQFLPEEVMTAIAQAEEGIVSGSVTVQEAVN
jgi:basic membrane protein A